MSIFTSRAFSLSLVTGLLLWLAFPGGGELWPVAGVALLPLLYLAKGEGKRKGFRISFFGGFCCGLLHHVLLLYWLVTVLSQYGGLPLFVAIPGLLVLCCYMALYFGLFTAVTSFFYHRFSPVVFLFLVPAIWVGLDWFRGIFLTGLPWMDLGYVLFDTPLLIQVADLFGHHGLTYLIVFINSLIFLVVQRGRPAAFYGRIVLVAVIVLGSAGFYSKYRLGTMGEKIVEGATGKITVGVVQGNIDQSVKWSPGLQKATAEKYFHLTEALISEGTPAFVVWPETALPFFPKSGPHTELLWEHIKSNSIPVLTGSPWYEVVDLEKREIKFFNSALLFLPDGRIGGTYYKNHLVPFGEYVPAKKFLPFLAPLVEAVGDFSPGIIENPIEYRGAKGGVLICFESVFPELSRKWVEAGANLLVNLTNDAWYGKSSAPYHSLAMAVLRAVETRRSVVRSANTGISAFITPDGTIQSQSEIFVPWVGQGKVPLLVEKTFWVRYGYLFGPLCLLLVLGAVLLTAARAVIASRQTRRTAEVEERNLEN